MKNILPTSFKNDQYFIVKKNNVKRSLNKIENIIRKKKSDKAPYEKVWIPEKQINGSINKFDFRSFEKINNYFSCELKPLLEKKTGVSDLELVAVRKNILKKNESISMHKDVEGYIAAINILKPEKSENIFQKKCSKKNRSSESTFKGGTITFRKDDGKLVEIDLQYDELLVLKCTNDHGVKKVLSGTRESITLFSRPMEL